MCISSFLSGTSVLRPRTDGVPLFIAVSNRVQPLDRLLLEANNFGIPVPGYFDVLVKARYVLPENLRASVLKAVLNESLEYKNKNVSAYNEAVP